MNVFGAIEPSANLRPEQKYQWKSGEKKILEMRKRLGKQKNSYNEFNKERRNKINSSLIRKKKLMKWPKEGNTQLEKWMRKGPPAKRVGGLNKEKNIIKWP